MASMSEYFQYLDELRASGTVNMYGTTPYLQDVFGIDKELARSIGDKWRKTYNAIQTPQERAAQCSK